MLFPFKHFHWIAIYPRSVFRPFIYRGIDAGQSYSNEQEIGDAIAEAAQTLGLIVCRQLQHNTTNLCYNRLNT